jgi:carboxylesterase
MAEQKKSRSAFGVLVLHGFTGTLESVNALRAPLEALGVPVAMPLLAGHGAASPEALESVGWHDWLADAEQALQQLHQNADRIMVIGHSMGALLALHLAVNNFNMVDSLVLATPPIKLFSLFAPDQPLHLLAPFVSLLLKTWELQTIFSDTDHVALATNYPWAPTSAILSFFELIKQTLPLLHRVTVPVLVLQCRRESTVHPESASMLCDRIATAPAEKSIIWLEHSDHQIFCDGEREQAVRFVIDYVSGRMTKHGAV